MYILIQGHPEQRMEERGVRVADIKSALENFHFSVVSGDAVQYEGPGLDGRTLKVWLLAPGLSGDHNRLILKSVAWKGGGS